MHFGQKCYILITLISPDSGQGPGLFYVVIILFQLCLPTTDIGKKAEKIICVTR